ncbi:MAG: superoxide dismutase [Flavobacteriales bacterium]
MDKRKFLKVSGIVGAGVVLSPLMSCSNPEAPAKTGEDATHKPKDSKFITEFTQATLGYDYAALEPKIDAQTMEIHFSKHHAGYVRKLNAAMLKEEGFSTTGITDLLSKISADQTGLRNNGGGHFNHTLFWECMKPGGAAAPSGKLAESINSAFGSEEQFKEQFFKAAKTRFGSGWAWLNADNNGKLFISSTPNQDNPLMTNIVKETGTPILGIDVWEHAYYLKYQNLRGDYINSFMDLVNWDVVSANLAGA